MPPSALGVRLQAYYFVRFRLSQQNPHGDLTNFPGVLPQISHKMKKWQFHAQNPPTTNIHSGAKRVPHDHLMQHSTPMRHLANLRETQDAASGKPCDFTLQGGLFT